MATRTTPVVPARPAFLRACHRARLAAAPLALLLAAGALAGCAAHRPAAAPGRIELPPLRAQQATPEPDPAWRATVQAPLASLGLDQVTVQLALDPRHGRVRLVEVLSPELTPADKQELERAFEAVPWRPRVDAEGQAETWTGTLLRERP